MCGKKWKLWLASKRGILWVKYCCTIQAHFTMWGFFNFSKCRHAPNLSHRLISPRHSSCCLALTSAKTFVNSEVLTEEYRICLRFHVFSLISFLSRIKTQTSRSLVIPEIHSDMKWEAVLCVLHPREVPRPGPQATEFSKILALFDSRVTPEFLDQALTYCITSILWKLHLKKNQQTNHALWMHSEAKQKQFETLWQRGLKQNRLSPECDYATSIFLIKSLSFHLGVFGWKVKKKS